MANGLLGQVGLFLASAETLASVQSIITSILHADGVQRTAGKSPASATVACSHVRQVGAVIHQQG